MHLQEGQRRGNTENLDCVHSSHLSQPKIHFSQNPLLPPQTVYIHILSYTKTGQRLLYCLKKVKWAASSSLSCRSLSCGAQSVQISAMWGRLSAAVAQDWRGEGWAVGKWLCWRTKASGSVLAPLPPPPLASPHLELTFRLPCRHALLQISRHWH